MSYTETFEHIGIDDAKTYGGKAASLGEMTQAGFPIPPGFAISAQACRDFATGNPSDKFVEELLKSFDRLGADRVAVRSSAIAEDASDASWAGQLESYLNVTRNNLLMSVQECWKSIFSEWAKDYAKDKDVSEEDLLVAVAVQKMVDSDKSGVMFTADPITRDRNMLVIEAVYGLGEMIVQGLVTPDHWNVMKQPREVTNFEIAVQGEMMVYRESQNKVVRVPDEIGDKAILNEEQVLELTEIGLGIENHYSVPQDIEWAIETGRFYIVQARPITTL